ncbi:MAG TPA: hypothetical protein VIK48_02270 [Candidatus Manganitrophaceae bacterium]
MSRSFLKGWIMGSAVLVLSFFLFFQWSGRPSLGWGLLIGGVWSLSNIFLLKRLAALLFHPGEKSILLIALFLFLKFPVLYGGGFLLLWFLPVSLWGAFVGFTLPFAFVFLQAVYLAAGGLAGSPSRIGEGKVF